MAVGEFPADRDTKRHFAAWDAKKGTHSAACYGELPRGSISCDRHMYHAHARHQLEQLARHVGPGPASGRRHIELVRICFGVGDEFETRRDRN
jgi:hypothetical protein